MQYMPQQQSDLHIATTCHVSLVAIDRGGARRGRGGAGFSLLPSRLLFLFFLFHKIQIEAAMLLPAALLSDQPTFLNAGLQAAVAYY